MLPEIGGASSGKCQALFSRNGELVKSACASNIIYKREDEPIKIGRKAAIKMSTKACCLFQFFFCVGGIACRRISVL